MSRLGALVTVLAALLLVLRSAHAGQAAASETPTPIAAASIDRDGLRATLRALSDSVEVGEPLRVRLEVEAAPGAEVRFPSAATPGAPRPMLGEFELRSAKRLPPDPARPTMQAQELELVCFASGLQELPPIELRRGGASDAEPITIGPLRIEVRSLVGEVEDPRTALRPVKEAVDIDLPRDWRIVALGGVALLVLLAIVIAIWRRLRRPRLVVVLTPEEEARAALAALADDDLPSRGRVFDFYVRLSDIVRHYVEGRFGIRAPEQTTKEFLAAASRHPLMVEGHRVLLAGFLRTADRVKFAAERPEADDCARAFTAASGFVDETAVPDETTEVRP